MLRAGFSTLGQVAPALAAEYAERLFCRPPTREVRPQETEFLATGARFELRTGRETIAAWKWGGEGPLALLLHGWGSRASRWWRLVPGLVDDGFRVVAFDQPAHGESSGEQVSLPRFVETLEAMVSRLGQAPALLCGHSLGGSAAVIGMHRGIMTRRAVLLGAPSEQREYAERFARTVGLPDAARDIMMDNLSRRLGLTWSDLDLPPLVEGLEVPALIVHDRSDAEVAFAHGERLAASWPGAELLATDGLGHSGALEDVVVMQRVRQFAAEAR